MKNYLAKIRVLEPETIKTKMKKKAKITLNNNKQKSIQMSLTVYLLLLISCNIFTPQPDPGSRNYIWELDTLNMPMNYIGSVYGASPNDVWAVGAGGTQYDRLMHYNGSEWTTYTNEVIWCSGEVLFGFSENNIWMGGQAGWLERGAGIWHYDGIKWEQNFVYSLNDNYHAIYIHDIWGLTPNDVYACGVISYYDGIDECWRGFVLKYDGIKWKEIVRADFDSQFYSVRKEDDDIIIASYVVDYDTLSGGDIEFYCMQQDDSTLNVIDSYKESMIYWANISSINEQIYFTIGQEIFKYKNNRLVKFLHIDNDKFSIQACGRNSKDIFLFMNDGIVHYNGIDLEYIYEFPYENMSVAGSPAILENDIYYSIRHNGSSERNLVLHGRKTEE